MSKTKEYGDFEKGIVVRMHLKGASLAKITEETGVSRSTQSRIRKNEEEDGYLAPENHVENRGRKPAIGYQNGRKIVKASTDDRSLTAA
jgi:transposase